MLVPVTPPPITAASAVITITLFQLWILEFGLLAYRINPKSIYGFVSSFVLNLITSFSAGTFSITLLTSSSPSILENFIASLTSGKIALAAGGLAGSAFVATNTATAAAVLAWVFAEWVTRRKPTVLGAASGAVAGLVAITPASGFVGPISSIIIGVGAGIFCYAACNLRAKLRYDDSLDVVGVHGIGGTWGALATGLFASKLINPAGADGLFFGNPGQLRMQALAVLATWVFAFFGTLIILSILKAIMGLRISVEKELEGIDISQHGEVAYSGFQMISSLGSSEMKALEEEIEELEKRKEKILKRMGSGEIERRIHYETSPPPIQGERGEAIEEETNYRPNSPFRIVVENVNREELRKWWGDMCYERVSDRPNEFNDIFKQLKKFHDGSFLFRKGDPDEIRRKLQVVLRRFNPKFRIEVEEE